VSSTTFSISWILPDSCNRRVDEYIVRYNHLGWQACYDESPSLLSVSNVKPEDPIKEIKLGKQSRSYELGDLHPYSKYNISIEAIDKGKLYGKTILATYQTEFPTKSSIPNTKPSSYEANRLVNKEHIIIFQWKEPEPDQCTNQNGKLDGYYVELRGVDPWARGENGPVIRNESVQALSYTAFELLPYTTYELWVHTKNLDVSEMSKNKLILKGKTLASKPGVPEHVIAQTVSNSSIHLSWYPAYPRTGEIDHYVVKRGVQGPDNRVVYTDGYSVPSSHESACGDNPFKSNSSVKICYAFDDLEPGQTYFFQVQTINKIGGNESASDLSEHVSATTLGVVTTEASTTSGLIIVTETPKTPIVPTEDKGANLTYFVIGTVALVFLLILWMVLRYRWKLKVLKERLRLEESIHKNRMDQNFTMSMSTLDTSFRPGQFDTSTITRLDYSIRTDSSYMDETMLSKDGPVYTNTSTIQSRRLPVPPPLSVTGPPQPGLLQSVNLHGLPGSEQPPSSHQLGPPSSHNQLGLPTEYNQPRGSPRSIVVGCEGPQMFPANSIQQLGYDTPRSLNVSPVVQGYLDMSLKRRKAQKKAILEDTEGYMEPRFHSSQLSRTDEVISDDENGVSPITAASYGTTMDQSSHHEDSLKQERKDVKVKATHETDQSKVNLLQYERPDLLSTVKPEQSSQDSDQSDGSNHFLLSSSQIV